MNLYKSLVLTGALIASVTAAPRPAAGGTRSTAHHSEAFRDWMENRRSKAVAFSADEKATGLALARARRAEMKALIQRDPAAALKWSVSSAEKSALPRDIADELETEISGTGYAGPLMADPPAEVNAAPSVSMTVRGQVLRVFLHGSQLNRKQWYGEPVKGIVLDDVAVIEDPAGVSLSAAAVIRAATKTVTRSYALDKLVVEREGEFDRIRLEGLAQAADEPGTPALPSETINVALPPGVTVKGIRVSFDETKIRDGVVPFPVQRPLPMNGSTDTNFTPPNAEAYASIEIQPKAVAALAGDHNRLGHRYVSIRLNPLRYIGATKSLYGVSDVTVSVDYELPVIAPAAPTSETLDEAMASVQRLVINPDEVQSPSATVLSTRDVTPKLASGGSNQVDYLIITSDELVPAFSELAAHRQAYNGFTTEILTVSNIVENYSGMDTQAMIRACIIDYFTTRNLGMVVLGGDDKVVPVRYCVVDAFTSDTEVPTDLYYSGLDGTWDNNGNKVYGQASAGEGDMAYDVVVGRIPVRSPADALGYIGKVMNFDTNTPWQVARRIMLTGTRLWDTYTSANRPSDVLNDGHVQFQDTRNVSTSDTEIWMRRLFRDFVQTNGNDYAAGCLADTLTSWDRTTVGDFVESADHLVEKADLGWNMRIHLSHGMVTAYETELGWSDQYAYGLSQASAQTNLTLVLYANSCMTGAFDEHGGIEGGWQPHEPCLSEALLRNPNGGALIYLGSSRYGWGVAGSDYGGYSVDYMIKWLEQMFVLKEEEAGKAFAEHKLALAGLCGSDGNMRWIQFSTNLQGDPALRLIGAKPGVTVQADAPLTVEGGASPGRFAVRRDPALGELTVNLSYSGTASGADIVESLPTSLTFADGESEKVVTVTPVNDGLSEADETVTVAVVTNALYEPASLPATVTIMDHAALPVIRLEATDDTACEALNPLPADTFTVTRSGAFTITRLANTAGPLTIQYILSGTARAADYAESLTGTITLAAGQVSANLTITPVDDVFQDGNTTVILTLQASANYVVADATSATVTILDDDPLPVVTVTATDATATEHSADTGTFRISRTGDTTLPLSVMFSMGGTCSSNRYSLPASPVTIPAGASSLDLTVTPINDTAGQPPETITLTLIRDGESYVVGSASSAVVTMLDEDNVPPSISLLVTPTNFVETTPVSMTAIVSDDWGISRVRFQRGSIVLATITNPPYRYDWPNGSAGSYDIKAVVTDLYGAMNTATVRVTGTSLPAGPGTGYLVDWWTNVVGTGLAALTNDVRYPATPDGSMVTTSALNFTLSNTNSYGVRCRGFYVPPMDGDYWFSSYAAGGGGDMWLSTDESPENKQALGWVTLKAGKRYYFERLYKHDSGEQERASAGCYVGIGGVMYGLQNPIPSHRMEPWHAVSLVAGTNAVSVPEGGTAEFDVALDQAPAGSVAVTVSRASGDDGITLPGITNLTFDAGNWSVPQTVTVASAEDISMVPGVATIACLSPTANPVCIVATESNNDTNQPPFVAEDMYQAYANSPLSVPVPGVLGNDYDTNLNPLTASLATDVSHGTLTFNADGSFTYEPYTNWLGTDSFTYRANNGQYDSDTATVTVTVLDRPRVISAESIYSTNLVIVTFDRDMKTTPAETPSNYALDQGVTVVSADLDYDQRTLWLVTSGMATDLTYTLTINNLTDMNTNAPILPDTQVQFVCAPIATTTAWFDQNGQTGGYGIADGASYDWLGGAVWNGDKTGGQLGMLGHWTSGKTAGLVGVGDGTSYTVTLGSADDQTVTVSGKVGLNWNFENSTALGSGHAVIGGESGTGTLQLSANTHFRAISGTLTINSDVNLSNRGLGFGNTTTSATPPSDVVINGQITGTGFVDGLSYGRGGTLTLNNLNNTFSGRTLGHYIGYYNTLAVAKLANGGQPSSIGTSPDNIAINGGTLKFIGTGAQATDLGFHIGSGNATIEAAGPSSADTIIFSGAPTYSSANAARNITLKGSNPGENTLAFNYPNNGTGLNSLTKTGTGRWVLTGSNTYTGATTVNGGTLEVNGSLASPATVASGTLGGTGSVGAVTLQAGGILAPGCSVGTMTMKGPLLTQSDDSLMWFELASAASYDRVAGLTNVTLGGTLRVATVGGFTPEAGNAFTLITASAVSGTFTGTDLPALGAGMDWLLEYGSGALVLSVTGPPPVTGYDAYALQVPNPAQRGGADDPDGDGHANLIEYVAGLCPTNNEGMAWMTGDLSTNSLFLLRFTRDTNAVDATLRVEGTDGLVDDADWLSIAVNSNGVWSGAATVRESGGPNPVDVTVEDPGSAATGRFFRLRVTSP